MPVYHYSEYYPGEYHYPPSVESHIEDAQGGIYGPHTGTLFDSIRDTTSNTS